MDRKEMKEIDRLARTCVVVVNYQTPDLLQTTVESFKAFYPVLPMVIVDNGSQDTSRQVIEELCSRYEALTAEYRTDNAGHGPAMHGVIARREFDYYFFLDSDTETKRGGFLEEMLREFDDKNVYGVGQVFRTNRRGFYDAQGVPALVAAFMLIREEIYRTLPPFEHHGSPVTANFVEAARRKYLLRDVPVQNSIDHLHRGTVSRFGYGLGLKGKINYLLNKLGM